MKSVPEVHEDGDIISYYESIGVPTKMGESATYCMKSSKLMVIGMQTDASKDWIYVDDSNKITYEGFCAGAMKQAALAAGAVASLALMESF